MTDWNEHEDAISDVISDSIDMDWTSRIGAKAVVAWLNEKAPVTAAPSALHSVVVPVEREEYERLIRVAEDLISNTEDPGTEALAAVYCARRILAALSPEAPAREGVKYAVTSEYAVGITEHDPALTPRHEAPFFIKDGEDPAEFRALGKRLADTDHEAPAEGAGEHNPLRGAFTTVESVGSETPEFRKATIHMRFEGPEAAERAHAALAYLSRLHEASLRARSSAPEAIKAAYQRGWNDREDDIIERAERIAPEAREGDQPVAWLVETFHPSGRSQSVRAHVGPKPTFDFPEGYRTTIKPLYTRPSAPSADKLRIAVEALKRANGTLKVIVARGLTTSTNQAAQEAVAITDQALDALTVDGK